jgi:hypothetical protein
MCGEREQSEGSAASELTDRHELEGIEAARRYLETDRRERLVEAPSGHITSDGDRIAAERLRQHSDAEFARAHKALIWDAAKGNITFAEPQDEMVDARRIAPPRVTRPDHCADTPGFWNEHGRSAQEYFQVGRKYRDIRVRLNDGASLENLRKDNELGDAANFWYRNDDHVQLEEYKGRYFVDAGFHRVELAQRLELGEIPAKVRHARPKGSAS